MSSQYIIIRGEIPPYTETGVSVSNQLIYNELISKNRKVIVVEERSWNKNSTKKLIHNFTLFFKVLMLVVRKPIHIFYSNIPLSIGGLLKILIVLPLIKTFSGKTILIGHLHRGDFKYFCEKGKLNRIVFKRCLQYLDKLIVLSDKYAFEVSNFYTEIITDVIPNTSLVELNTAKLKTSYGKKFICISNYIETKGLETLIKSFKSHELKDLQLDVFGHGYEEQFLKKLQNIKSKNVTLHSSISRDKIQDLLLKYDCLILPSWNEGQPLVILEAMSLGIPVIATTVGDIPNMLGQDYPFLVIPKNVQDLLSKIKQFDNNSKKSDIARYLHERYCKHYSNKKHKELIFEIFS